MISACAWVPRGAARREPVRHELSPGEAAALRAQAAAARAGDAERAGAGDDDEELDDEDEEAALADPAFASLRGVPVPLGRRGGAGGGAGAAATPSRGGAASSGARGGAGAAAEEGGRAGAADGGDGGEGGAGAAADGADAAPADADEDDDDDADEEDALDLVARPSDAFLLVATTEDDFSGLEVHCYDADDGSLYVHHDIALPAFPLALAWSDYAGDAAAGSLASVARAGGSYVGSFAAVGTFEPSIEVWNLDVLDPLEPTLVLEGARAPPEAGARGGARRARGGGGGGGAGGGRGARAAAAAAPAAPARATSAPAAPRAPGAGHSAAVLGLSWNREHRHLLASASEDATVRVWDLDAGGRCLAALSHHAAKVTAVAWNPAEASVLATAADDGTAAVTDARAGGGGGGRGARVGRYALPGEPEALSWSPHAPATLLVACGTGDVLAYDVRSPDAPLWRLRAHKAACTSLALSPLARGLLATASVDKSVRLWDLDATGEGGGAPQLVASKAMGIGQVYCVAFLPSEPFTLAAGGGKGVVAVWDVAGDGGDAAAGLVEGGPSGTARVGPDASLTARRFDSRVVEDAATVPGLGIRPRADGQRLAGQH